MNSEFSGNSIAKVQLKTLEVVQVKENNISVLPSSFRECFTNKFAVETFLTLFVTSVTVVQLSTTSSSAAFVMLENDNNEIDISSIAASNFFIQIKNKKNKISVI